MASNMSAADLLDIMEMKAPAVPVLPGQDREAALWLSSRAQWVQELRTTYGITAEAETENAGVYRDVLQPEIDQ